MTAQTGRTVNKFATFNIDDSGGTLRSIPVNSINGVGLTYEEHDLTAWFDAIKGALPGIPSLEVTIKGPFDNTANTGSHTVLARIVGGVTPLSMDIQVGMRHAWEAGEPQFGITADTTNGMLCTDYSVNLDDMSYTAKFIVFAGSAAPAWGTVAET